MSSKAVEWHVSVKFSPTVDPSPAAQAEGRPSGPFSTREAAEAFATAMAAQPGALQVRINRKAVEED